MRSVELFRSRRTCWRAAASTPGSTAVINPVLGPDPGRCRTSWLMWRLLRVRSFRPRYRLPVRVALAIPQHARALPGQLLGVDRQSPAQVSVWPDADIPASFLDRQHGVDREAEMSGHSLDDAMRVILEPRLRSLPAILMQDGLDLGDDLRRGRFREHHFGGSGGGVAVDGVSYSPNIVCVNCCIKTTATR